jgi:hypothetical protein
MKSIADIVARIAMDVPRPPNHHELLQALHEAAQAGEIRGYERGMTDGMNHVSRSQEMIMKAVFGS